MSQCNILPNKYSGTFRGTNNIVFLEIRMDPLLNIISGDLYFLQRDDQGTTIPVYMYSFITFDLAITKQSGILKIHGNMNFFRYTTLEGTIDITISNDDTILSTLSFRNRLNNPRITTATMQLEYISPYFRDIELEIDYMEGTKLLPTLNISTVKTRPSNLPNEEISLTSLFAKAGINAKVSSRSDTIPVGPTETWSEDELHAIMEQNMSEYDNIPQWRLYLLIATTFENPNVLGIIYDTTDDVPRQGSAVFTKHRMIDGDTPEHKREYLYTALHELGHAFNLYHSFHKGLAGPFEFPKPDSLSVMNYPQLFPYGSNAPSDYNGSESFWSQFRYSFDDDDLLHIRHHDLYDVIMGGKPFGEEGHFKENMLASFTRSNKLMEFSIRSKTVFEYGEPVLVETKLKNISSHSLNVPATLNIKDGYIFTSIEGPDGKTISYKPMIKRCGLTQTTQLAPSKSKYEDLYLYYGKDGFYFKNPGRYKIQSALASFNGIIKSGVHEILVADPQSLKETKNIRNIFTRRTGQYQYLKGSDYLLDVEKELITLERDMNDTNLAKYIELYIGSRKSRKFKTPSKDKIKIRQPDYKNALKHLESSLSNTRSEEFVFDNILLNRIMNKVSDIQKEQGNITEAKDTLADLISKMKDRKVTATVIDDLENKHDSIK